MNNKNLVLDTLQKLKNVHLNIQNCFYRNIELDKVPELYEKFDELYLDLERLLEDQD